jgi:hypothetical protein
MRTLIILLFLALNVHAEPEAELIWGTTGYFEFYKAEPMYDITEMAEILGVSSAPESLGNSGLWIVADSSGTYLLIDMIRAFTKLVKEVREKADKLEKCACSEPKKAEDIWLMENNKKNTLTLEHKVSDCLKYELDKARRQSASSPYPGGKPDE